MSKVVLKVLQEAALFRARPKVSHLILHVTNICNFRCNHCFVEFAEKPKDLTLDEVEQVAGVFDDLIWLDIGGGEPFIREDLPEIVAKFKAQEVSIPTNGWFTEKILVSIKRMQETTDIKHLIITISVDGLPETHDEIRQKKGSFDQLSKTYELVRKNFPGLRVKINTVLNNRNLKEIIPLMKRVKEDMQPDFHSILFLRGSPINPGYCLPPTKEIRALEDQIFEVQQGYLYGRKGVLSDIQRNYQWIKREVANQIVEKNTQVIPCLGGQAHVVVYANGDVAPCELLPSVGSIRKIPLSEILNDPAWEKAVKGIKAKECNCTHDCNMVENVLFNFNLYPQLLFGSKSGVSKNGVGMQEPLK